MGTGTKTMLNPPPLEGSDAFVMRWYAENATAFVQEFGLMKRQIDGLGLSNEERRVFLAKLGKIHGMVLRMRMEEMEKGRS